MKMDTKNIPKEFNIFIHRIAVMTNELADYISLLKRNGFELSEDITKEITNIQDSVATLYELINNY